MAGYKVLAITDAMLASHWQGEHYYRVCLNPLPKDAKFVNMCRNPKTNEIEFTIFSEKYEWTKPGNLLRYVDTPRIEDRK